MLTLYFSFLFTQISFLILPNNLSYFFFVKCYIKKKMCLSLIIIFRYRTLYLFYSGLYNENRSSEDFVAYATSLDPSDGGFDFPSYEEPPPPYSSMNKPCDDEPPPYEHVAQDGLNSATEALNNTPVNQEQVADSDGQINASRRCRPPGAFAYCTTPTDLENARGRAVKFWLVAGPGDRRPKSAESFELQNLTTSFQLSNACGTDDRRQNENNIPVQFRPLRKKCGKCRHSADATVGQEWTRSSKLRNLSVVSSKRQPDNAMDLTSVGNRTADASTTYDSMSSVTSRPETGGVGASCGTVEDENESYMHNRVGLVKNHGFKADTYFGNRALEPWRKSNSTARNDDIMVCSAPAEAFANCGSFKPKTKFRISSEHLGRSSHRPVSCDMANIAQFGMNRSRLFLESPDVAVLPEPIFDCVPEYFQNLSDRCYASSAVHRRPPCAEGETNHRTCRPVCAERGAMNNASTTSECLDDYGGLPVHHCNRMKSPALSEQCGLSQVSGSTDSLSSICAETGEKKTGVIVPSLTVRAKSPGPRHEKVGAEVGRETVANVSSKPNATPVVAAVSSAWSCQADAALAVKVPSDDISEPSLRPYASQSGLREVRKSVKRSSRQNDSEPSSGSDYAINRRSKVEDCHPDDYCPERTATYEYVIDRILEQIEAARIQFGWKNSGVPVSTGLDDCHANLLHKCRQPHRAMSASSCGIQRAPDDEGSASVKRALSDVPQLLADEDTFLDVMNSNMDVSELSKVPPNRQDLSTDVHEQMFGIA
jgi:hypothetical protein